MSTSFRPTFSAAVILLLAGLTAAPAFALTDEEVFRSFRFNFVNPGGRALAMGGAFVGIADDATAAAANPAGLTNLVTPELFSEWRFSDVSTSEIVGEGFVPTTGFPPAFAASKSDPKNVLHPSFVSFVKPFNNWVFGISRQELVNAESSGRNQIAYTKDGDPTVESLASIDMLLEYYNLSFGFNFGSMVSGGVTLSYARLDVDARTDNFFQYNSTTGLEPDYATVTEDQDDDFAWSAGLMIRPHDKLTIGLVVRAGAEFELDESLVDTRLASNSFDSVSLLADYLGDQDFDFTNDPLSFVNTLKVPDQYAIGFGIRPTEAMTIAVDVTLVEFSDLESGFVGNVNPLTFPGDPASCSGGDCEYTTPIARYEFDDEVIWRVGFEYIWTLKESIPFAARAGVYNAPNTRLEADFGGPDERVYTARESLFPSGDDQTHFTLGLGIVIQDKFQVDIAADFANNESTFISSLIYHF